MTKIKSFLEKLLPENILDLFRLVRLIPIN